MAETFNPAWVAPIIGLLLAILGMIWRFNNNVVKSNIALIGAVDDIKELKTTTNLHGNKISELVGGFNSRSKVSDHIKPLGS